jgi:tRNA modification GTPase
VTIGCDGEDYLAINCHGNPLIAADIMNLLKKLGARLIKPDDILEKIYISQGLGTIEIESKLAIVRAKTLIGTKIISNQIKGGLKKKASGWLKNKKNLTIEKIRKEAEQILENTKRARPIIYGAKIVLAGPANSGKSTLLNFLAGKQKAIVTDIAGTTLDYVSAECKIGTLYAQIIDTAGIRTLNSENKPIEKEAQRGSVKIISDADMVLLIIDNSKKDFDLDERVITKILSKPVITVLNKSDLEERFDSKILPKELKDVVKISAKTGYGIDKLIKKINEKFEISRVDTQAAVCVNKRQERLIRQLKETNSKKMAFDIISELLNGRV